MALSMEEQRILAEIENELARSEPALAAYLSAFGRAGMLRSPQRREWGRGRQSAGAGKTEWGRARSAGAGKILHSPRVLVVASLAAIVLLTVIPVVVYALVSLHAVPKGRSAGHPTVSAQHHAVPPHPVMSAPR